MKQVVKIRFISERSKKERKVSSITNSASQDKLEIAHDDVEVSNEIFHEYTYDKNGNMSFVIKYINDETIAEIDYMYHITYKDRLSSVINTWTNGTTTSLTYSTSDRFKPSKNKKQ